MSRLFHWITPQFAAAVATLVLLLSPFLVWAASTVMEATDPRDGAKIALYVTACTHDAILMEIPPEYRAEFRQAEYRDPKGKVTAACWMLVPGGRVLLVYEDGDKGMVPMQAFKPRVDA